MAALTTMATRSGSTVRRGKEDVNLKGTPRYCDQSVSSSALYACFAGGSACVEASTQVCGHLEGARHHTRTSVCARGTIVRKMAHMPCKLVCSCDRVLWGCEDSKAIIIVCE